MGCIRKAECSYLYHQLPALTSDDRLDSAGKAAFCKRVYIRQRSPKIPSQSTNQPFLSLFAYKQAVSYPCHQPNTRIPFGDRIIHHFLSRPILILHLTLIPQIRTHRRQSPTPQAPIHAWMGACRMHACRGSPQPKGGTYLATRIQRRSANLH